MTWWQRFFKREQMERQLDAELRFHFDELVAANLRAGMTETEARRRSRLEFGGLDQVKEECRDARGTRWLEDLLRDVRFDAITFVAVPIVLSAVALFAVWLPARRATRINPSDALRWE